jgi:superfamily II DNA or RNA helicase
MILRPYQLDAENAIRRAFSAGFRRPLFVGPTGMGKTNLFSSMTLGARAKGNSVWILVHRVELADNTGRTLSRWGVDFGTIAAGVEYDGNPVQVVAVATLAGRIRRGWIPPHPPEILIVDEADLAAAETWQVIFRAFPSARVVGFTATPQRRDGKGLGDSFDTLVPGPSPAWLMDNGFLARPTYWGVPLDELPDLAGVGKSGGDFDQGELRQAMERKPVITGNVLTHYVKRGAGAPFIGFAVSISEAERFAREFTAGGIPCAAIHGDANRLKRGERTDLDPTTRHGMKNALERGRIRGLWSVDIFGRGVDIPAVKCGIDCAPTTSLPKHLQRIGRTVRVDDSFPCNWIDCVGNLMREGLGPLEMDRELTLEGIKRKPKEAESLQSVTQCPACFRMYLPAPCCPGCGHVPAVIERKVKTVAGSLKLLTAKEIESAQMEAKRKRMDQGQAKTEGELVRQFMAQGSSRGKSTIRARIILKARRDKAQTVDRKPLAT